MTNKLLPCPFCGGEARIETCNDNGAFRVSCHRIYECGATQYWYDFETEAIAAWNRRAQPENKPLKLEELKQMEGEPVWIVTLDGTDEPRWEIVVSAGKCGVDLICVVSGVETRDYADFDLYNDTWLAYRNKPVKEE